MDWQNILNVVLEFLNSVSMPLILGLVMMDLALGVFDAIKKGEFEWRRVGEFYRTMVIPYVGGYLVLQVAFTVLPDQLATVLSPALSGVALAAILTSLTTSILGHLKGIGIQRLK